MQQVDNIIIGAGPGGYELAATLANRGETVVIVERDKPGGTCLNRGCIPTKCLCATAEKFHVISNASQFGITTSGAVIDYPQAINRMRQVVENLQQGIIAEISNATYIQGDARLIDQRTITVNDEQFTATKRLIIATGSRPAILPIEGNELAVTSDEVLADEHLPESVIIVGGGVIGMEFASIFNTLGVKTTVIEYCKEILPPFEADIAKRLRTAMSRKGIEIIVGAAVKSCRSFDDGRIQVEFEGKRGLDNRTAERVIMAVGRRPVLPEGITELGIETTPKGFIAVNDMMQTNIEGVYAIGDVNGLSMLAHSAIAQGKVISSENPQTFRRDCIPSVVFTMPEVAMVGKTSAQLDAEGISYHVVKRQFASNGKACAMGENDGTIRIICNDNNDILGITIMGPHASDLIAEATILVSDHIRLDEVAARFTHAHPTLSEIFI